MLAAAASSGGEDGRHHRSVYLRVRCACFAMTSVPPLPSSKTTANPNPPATIAFHAYATHRARLSRLLLDGCHDRPKMTYSRGLGRLPASTLRGCAFGHGGAIAALMLFDEMPDRASAVRHVRGDAYLLTKEGIDHWKTNSACVIVAVFYCFLKQLAEFSDTDQQTVRGQDARNNETEPILPRKRVVFSYGATEEQPESSMCSSEDTCSDNVCKICYDAPRSCFFIPCGHGFACYTCARRIAEDKNQACPICRRLIHRVRRLVEPLGKDFQ
uniref:RING-type domain-containing protein n=1 Tax=Oryza rufipogon TaxID=4529 RepID=A0A0E0PVW3_ORYRU